MNHRKILHSLFEHPVSANIAFKDVEHLCPSSAQNSNRVQAIVWRLRSTGTVPFFIAPITASRKMMSSTSVIS